MDREIKSNYYRDGKFRDRIERKLNPKDIKLPKNYEIEVFAKDLNTPINLTFSENNEMFIADSGVTSGSGKVLKLTPQGFKVIAEGFNPPLTGINCYKGDIYVSHRGFITVVKPDGTKKDILSGLPSYGDHHNNRVVFGPDGRMYFGQGTATNSGVVGLDNKGWVLKYPFFHDYPNFDVFLAGQNFATENILIEGKEMAYTGAYLPFGVPSMPYERVKGIVPSSGCILSADIDGSNLSMVASGLRNPFRMKFDNQGRLFSTNHGMDVRGSRPVANSPDEFHMIMPNAWYGWPDYTGGIPLTHPMFKPENEEQPYFLLAQHPMIPPKPLSNFVPHSAIMGFDFNYNEDFAPLNTAFIAEFGSLSPGTTGGVILPKPGHRVSMIDLKSGQIYTFAINNSGLPSSQTGEGGFERPIDVVFGPDNAMYIVDFCMATKDNPSGFIPNTGVIWRIKKVK